MKDRQPISRREFLKITLLGVVGAAASGCHRPASPDVTVTPGRGGGPTSTPTELPTATPTGVFVQGSQAGAASATETPTPMPTPTETPTPEPTLTPRQEAFQERAVKIAETVNLTPEAVRSQLEAISEALGVAGVNFSSILEAEKAGLSTNPEEISGIDRYPEEKRARFILPEGGTGYISFGGGSVAPENWPILNLPNGVVDLSQEASLAADSNYPYASQVYQVLLNLGAGPDVWPPQIPDQDLNGSVGVRTNAELMYSYMAYGSYNSGGNDAPNTISADWLAEQVWWGTGGATNCGTGCGLSRLVLVHFTPDTNYGAMNSLDHFKPVLTLVDVTRITDSTNNTVSFRANVPFACDYTREGINKLDEFLAGNVLPTWPERGTATPTPTS